MRYIYPAKAALVGYIAQFATARWSHSRCRASFLAASLRPICGRQSLHCLAHGMILGSMAWLRTPPPRKDGERRPPNASRFFLSLVLFMHTLVIIDTVRRVLVTAMYRRHLLMVIRCTTTHCHHHRKAVSVHVTCQYVCGDIRG